MEITFVPLTEDELPMLCQWLSRPHVAEWWGTPPTLGQVRAKYHPRIQAKSKVRPYLIMFDGAPVGYIQSYVAVETDDGWWPGQHDEGVHGIDQFLADGSRLGQGLGTRTIATFVDFVFEDPAAHRVQADPAPDNGRAIRCYEKAGFRRVGPIQTPHGEAVLMVHDRD